MPHRLRQKQDTDEEGQEQDEADDVDELERVRQVLDEEAADEGPEREAGQGRRRGMRRRPAGVAARPDELGQGRGPGAGEEADRETGGDPRREEHRRHRSRRRRARG